MTRLLFAESHTGQLYTKNYDRIIAEDSVPLFAAIDSECDEGAAGDAVVRALTRAAGLRRRKAAQVRVRPASRRESANLGAACLSQWYPVAFTEGAHRFATAEHYMIGIEGEHISRSVTFRRVLGRLPLPEREYR